MHVLLRVLVVFLVFSASSIAAESPKLFKSFGYNAPLSEFPIGTQYYDCSADHQVTARCNDNYSFLDREFEIVFKFTADRLTEVLMATQFDEQIYTKAIAALSQDFSLVMLQGKKDRLDMIELARQSKTKTAYQARVAEYESVNLNHGQLSYVFIEQAKEIFQKSETAAQAVYSAPASARVAEMIVLEDEEEAFLAITFSLPTLDRERLARAIKQERKETF